MVVRYKSTFCFTMLNSYYASLFKVDEAISLNTSLNGPVVLCRAVPNARERAVVRLLVGRSNEADPEVGPRSRQSFCYWLLPYYTGCNEIFSCAGTPRRIYSGLEKHNF